MLITELGSDYAESTLYGTFFLYNGEPAQIRRVNGSRVLVTILEGAEEVSLDPSVLTGWKTLKYPRLGYRKMDDGLWGWVGRQVRSYTRGLNVDNTFYRPSQWLLEVEGAEWFHSMQGYYPSDFQDRVYEHEYNRDAAFRLMTAALSPVYDGKDGLRRVLEGKDKSFIPSPRFLVEPMEHSDKFGVYMSGTLLGKLDKEGNVYGPKKNLPIIDNMVKRYAA